jgi:hypothetical protein
MNLLKKIDGHLAILQHTKIGGREGEGGRKEGRETESRYGNHEGEGGREGGGGTDHKANSTNLWRGFLDKPV